MLPQFGLASGLGLFTAIEAGSADGSRGSLEEVLGAKADSYQ